MTSDKIQLILRFYSKLHA